MKGFPNQVAELPTLTRALRVMGDLVDGGANPKDDGVYGETLIRRGALGTGHTPVPADEYLRRQMTKSRSNQSHRTRARGLRELFRVLDLIDDSDATIVLTPTGLRVAALGDDALTPAGVRLWRTVILRMTHEGGDGEWSHPYQVLLRLVGKRPGITRAKCALALEAQNDSEDELERIAELSDDDEGAIIRRIGTTRANWNNAKKILPRFAEQLSDVLKVAGERFYLADVPGTADEAPEEQEAEAAENGARTPKGSLSVTAATIARSGTTEGWDEAAGLNASELDPAALESRKRWLRARLRRHNLLVQKAAGELGQEGAELFENPFDCLACFPDEGILIEVKSLDGTEADEVERVREAFAQLLYYAAFVTMPSAEEGAVKKVACFEQKITDAHVAWFESSDIHVLWIAGEGFDGSPEAKTALAGHFGF